MGFNFVRVSSSLVNKGWLWELLKSRERINWTMQLILEIS